MNNARVVVTGGAGFIGSNLTGRLVVAGHDVVVFDDLSRVGAQPNLAWLSTLPGPVEVVAGDVRDADAVAAVVRGADVVVHLAGQVAVTTSVLDPRTDFDINALGTLNVLEAARLAPTPPVVLYASTNKVYGALDDDGLVVEDANRYGYRDAVGISESQPLDFHSPYGCSKGSADQYVRDYARIYGLPTVVFRQSCIYGPRQFGVEDQGWLAHFVIAAQLGRPIRIYGDGKQVRDILHVDDLADAYLLALDHLDVAAGSIYNIGGGIGASVAIWSEVAPILEQLAGTQLEASFHPWRPGDQRVCVMDTAKIERELGWRRRIDPADGIAELWRWVADHRELVAAT